MRVAFDEQIFLMQRYGGISQSFFQLIEALNRDTPVTALPPPGAVKTPASPWGGDLLGSRLGARLALEFARRRPRRLPDHDLVHRTFYDPAWLAVESDSPVAITVHDMIPELMPDQVPPRVHLAKQEYVQRADLILTNSQTTKQDLLTHYGTPRAPIVVTPFGVSERFLRATPARTGTTSPHVLYVGGRGGYKRFLDLLHAVPLLPPSVRVLAVGGGPWHASELAVQRSLGIEDRVRRIDLADDELPGAYQSALALVVTSSYEGFGLPVLEAMASGTPVVTTRGGALPEVGGEAAVYVDSDPADIAAAVTDLWADPALRQELADAGRLRAREQSWSRTALATAEAYRSVLA